MDIPVLKPDQFMVMFPCFAVMSQNCKGGVVQRLDSGGIAVIVLTDEDLLREFRAKNGAIGPTVRFEFGPQMLLYLASLPDEITHVVFDPSNGRGSLFRISDVKQKLIAQAESGNF